MTLRIVAEHSAGSTILVDKLVRYEEPPTPKTLDIDAPIAICLATYNPDERLFQVQLESLRAQTRRDWVCIVHDDGSSPAHYEMIRHHLARDDRFRLVRSECNRGFYYNFEAALALVPASTAWVALCDQDDRWYPDKLAATISALESEPSAQLAYCDMRIVDQSGQPRSSSYWHTRRNNYQHLDTLLLANTVTGAASIFRGRLLDLLLPFPPAHGNVFHDHWIACCALVAGGLKYIDRPLYDYTQHNSNVIGQTDFAPLSVAGAMKRHAANLAEMILKPWHIGPSARAMLNFYYSDYRRLRIFADTLRQRWPSLSASHREILSLFEDQTRCALDLITREHAQVVLRGDSTDFVEFKMGLGMLFDRIRTSSLLG